MTRHHVIISGTGRAGTTFLVRLLGELGLDIGYSDPQAEVFTNCDAGLEWNIGDPGAPYVVKSPMLCDVIDGLVSSGKLVVDHALVPVRNLYAAAESRRDVSRRSDPAAHGPVVPGGLWPGSTPERQEAFLAQRLYALIEALARHDVPTTLLHFPRLATDADYLRGKLAPVTGEVPVDAFRRAFAAVSRPELIHAFQRPPQRRAAIAATRARRRPSRPPTA
jgi:hypothetical protein